MPTCPAHLSPSAKAEWKRLSQMLYRLGVITMLDRAVLAGYCQAYGRWVEAERKLKETPALLKMPRGMSSRTRGSPFQTNNSNSCTNTCASSGFHRSRGPALRRGCRDCAANSMDCSDHRSHGCRRTIICGDVESEMCCAHRPEDHLEMLGPCLPIVENGSGPIRIGRALSKTERFAYVARHRAIIRA
jgi:P27 family predicted phage terminase small subunit